MARVLHNYRLHHQASRYEVELIQQKTKMLFVCLRQTVDFAGAERVGTVRIHPEVLDDLIVSLSEMRNLIAHASRPESKTRLNPFQKNQIIYRYLNKNIVPEDLALQFNCSSDEIKQVLLAGGVVLADPKVPSEEKRKYRGRRSRKRV